MLALGAGDSLIGEPLRSVPPPPHPVSAAAAPDPVIGSGCTGLHSGSGQVTYRFVVGNSSRRPLEVLAVDRLGPGLRLIGAGLVAGGVAAPAAPFRTFQLAPGRSRLLQLRFQVNDCAAARFSMRLPVTVATYSADGSRRRSHVELALTASTRS